MLIIGIIIGISFLVYKKFSDNKKITLLFKNITDFSLYFVKVT